MHPGMVLEDPPLPHTPVLLLLLWPIDINAHVIHNGNGDPPPAVGVLAV